MSEEHDPTEEAVPESPEIHFEPIVKLPLVEIKTMEEGEEEILKLRAKLYRFERQADPPEWKERGVGDVKILKTSRSICRLVMRRDKTHKICANHYIQCNMQLIPNSNSDRAWVWSVAADFADEEAKPELLAIRFGTAENAKLFRDAFDRARDMYVEAKAGGVSMPTTPLKVDEKSENEKNARTSGDAALENKENAETSPSNTEENSSKDEENKEPARQPEADVTEKLSELHVSDATSSPEIKDAL